MSKFLKIPNGDYNIEVQSGGTITLDTGFDQGRVIITGDLEIRGDTTTINTQELDIEDNIIELNKGETGSGVTLVESGIRIDRGTLLDVFSVFNETLQWLDPVTETTQDGAFVLKNANNDLIGLRTNSITTGGEDLYLINNGNGVISVTGTTDYEKQIFEYDLNDINTGVVVDDDHIPNTKALVDYVQAFYNTNFLDKLVEADTIVDVNDESVTGNPSNVLFQIDGVKAAEMTATSLVLSSISEITTDFVDDNLVLNTTGVGTVQFKSVLEIEKATIEPPVPVNGAKLYTEVESEGGSGVYFVNENSRRDELIAKNRALAFSMMF